jgi:hypothetical protein
VTVLLVYAALLVLATVPVAGGRLGALAAVQLRGTPLVALALGVQVLIVSVVPGAPAGVLRVVHLSTYLVLAAFLWLNRRIAGVWLVAAGAACNAAAIAANGGVMPAAPAALAAAGLPPDKPGEFANSAALHAPSLSWLGDVFATPAAWGPAANVFSAGDLLIALGLAVALHRLAGSRLALRPRRAG